VKKFKGNSRIYENWQKVLTLIKFEGSKLGKYPVREAISLGRLDCHQLHYNSRQVNIYPSYKYLMG
jgi:hypothetical protein